MLSRGFLLKRNGKKRNRELQQLLLLPELKGKDLISQSFSKISRVIRSDFNPFFFN